MLKSINPHQPSEVMGEFEETGHEGVEEAVARAREAFLEWRERPVANRGGALAQIANELEGRAEELAQLAVREVGKPIGEARAELARAVAILRYYAQLVLAPDGETYPASPSTDWRRGRAAPPAARSPASLWTDWLVVRRYPAGVCGLLTPWNFPVAIPVWKAAPALGYGNTVVLKPAPESTVTAQMFTEIVTRYLPEGAFQ